ncbi:hypothetical protein GF314_11860 [bacterium]|nr:hypothetical protein [bacterium]
MSATESRARTPIHLWIVGVVALLWNAMGAYDYLMTQTRNEAYMSRFTPEQLEFFYGFPAWVDGAWAIAVWGAVLGSILLLMRSRWAGLAFVVSLVAMILTTIHNYGIGDGLEVMDGAGPLIFSAVIFLVGVALVIYARAMCNRNVLT